jgi:hypothetical protein
MAAPTRLSAVHPLYLTVIMTPALQQKMLQVCDRKIATKGPDVGISFYAFFANKNDDPEALMAAATWWIMTQKFDHFEKAVKIKSIIEEMESV